MTTSLPIFYCGKTLNIRLIILNFEVHNIVLFTIGTTLYSRSLELIHRA